MNFDWSNPAPTTALNGVVFHHTPDSLSVSVTALTTALVEWLALVSATTAAAPTWLAGATAGTAAPIEWVLRASRESILPVEWLIGVSTPVVLPVEWGGGLSVQQPTTVLVDWSVGLAQGGPIPIETRVLLASDAAQVASWGFGIGVGSSIPVEFNHGVYSGSVVLYDSLLGVSGAGYSPIEWTAVVLAVQSATLTPLDWTAGVTASVVILWDTEGSPFVSPIRQVWHLDQRYNVWHVKNATVWHLPNE